MTGQTGTSTRRAVAVGVGHYLPERVVPNAEFEAMVDTSDEWIRARSGIERRHFAAEGQTTSDLGIAAARAALDNAGLTADDIERIVGLALGEAFAHADDGRKAGGDGRAGLGADILVVLVMVLAALGMAQNDVGGAGIGQHFGRDIAGMRAGSVGVTVLSTDAY